MGVSGSLMGISWESHWTPSGISATKYGTPSIVPGDSHPSSSGVPETLLGIPRDSPGTPRILVGECNILGRGFDENEDDNEVIFGVYP